MAERADADRLVLVGVVAGAHGVRGEVRIRSFTANPRDIARYGTLSNEQGTRRFEVRVLSEAKGTVIARLDGVADRDAAEALRGVRLFVPRTALPKPGREEWYLADLVGLSAERKDGTAMGRVKSVENFGAGDLLEIERPDGSTVWLAFTRAAVPEIDVASGRLVVDPPEEIAGEVEQTSRTQRRRE